MLPNCDFVVVSITSHAFFESFFGDFPLLLGSADKSVLFPFLHHFQKRRVHPHVVDDFVESLGTHCRFREQAFSDALDALPMSADQHAGHTPQARFKTTSEVCVTVQSLRHQADLSAVIAVANCLGAQQEFLGFCPGHPGHARAPVERVEPVRPVILCQHYRETQSRKASHDEKGVVTSDTLSADHIVQHEVAKRAKGSKHCWYLAE